MPCIYFIYSCIIDKFHCLHLSLLHWTSSHHVRQLSFALSCVALPTDKGDHSVAHSSSSCRWQITGVFMLSLLYFNYFVPHCCPLYDFCIDCQIWLFVREIIDILYTWVSLWWYKLPWSSWMWGNIQCMWSVCYITIIGGYLQYLSCVEFNTYNFIHICSWANWSGPFVCILL